MTARTSPGDRDRNGVRRSFVAGCGRRADGPAELPELAYRELAYPECPTCPHRIEPSGVPPFCVWRPEGAEHPFAALAGWRERAP